MTSRAAKWMGLLAGGAAVAAVAYNNFPVDLGVSTLVREACEYAVDTVATKWREVKFAWNVRGRQHKVKVKASKRATRVLGRLVMEDFMDGQYELNDEEELDLSDETLVPCAYRLSRSARMALHYPKYSAANERIVSDWIQRHWPEGMRNRQKIAVLPLAIKLTFVRSEQELEAGTLHTMLGGLVDVA